MPNGDGRGPRWLMNSVDGDERAAASMGDRSGRGFGSGYGNRRGRIPGSCFRFGRGVGRFQNATGDESAYTNEIARLREETRDLQSRLDVSMRRLSEIEAANKAK